jgi:hypothetical protein
MAYQTCGLKITEKAKTYQGKSGVRFKFWKDRTIARSAHFLESVDL